MSIKVIGAGFGRTGTLSLKQALEILGFGPCYHMVEVGQNAGHRALWSAAADGAMPDWQALFGDYQASVDWPSCNFYAEQMAAFPEARVILTLRDPEAWYKSVMNTIWPFSRAGREAQSESARASADMAFKVIWDKLFDGRMDDKVHVLGVYQAHLNQVRQTVPADRLLEYQPGDGWEPLCRFLAVPVPAVDYPKSNSTAAFQQRLSSQ